MLERGGGGKQTNERINERTQYGNRAIFLDVGVFVFVCEKYKGRVYQKADMAVGIEDI